MREQWRVQVARQQRLVNSVKKKVLARVSTAPAGSHGAGLGGTTDRSAKPGTATPAPTLQLTASDNEGYDAIDNGTQPQSRRGAPHPTVTPLPLSPVDVGALSESAQRDLARLAEIQKAIRREKKALKGSTTASAAVLGQFLKQ